MSSVAEYLKGWDTIREPSAHIFKVKGDKTQRTVCGGVMAIICFILFVYIMIKNADLLLSRRQPYIQSTLKELAFADDEAYINMAKPIMEIS